MANYNANIVGMQDVEVELNRATGQLDTSLAALEQDVQRFITANHGQAPDSYATAQALWSQGQREMHTALTSGGQKLNDITTNYVMGDNRGAAIFS